MSPIAAPFGDRFLAEPASFPARAEGEPFGPEVLSVRIADQELRVEGLSGEQAAAIGALWSAFGIEGAAPGAIRLAVYRAEAARFREIDRRGWSYELDLDHGREGTRIAGLDLMARLDGVETPGAALWTSAETPEAFRGAFENVVRVLLARAALWRGGVLLHSSAVLENGRARLFLGRSGAGKSTVARLALASGRALASDDLNPVVPHEPGFHVFGSPFLGDVGSGAASSYPLAGIYRLVKGETDDLRSMGRAETVATLAACAPFVNRSPHLEERLWANLDALARRAPGYVLTFSREGTFWPLLRD